MIEMYKLYEELNKRDVRFMRLFYCIDLIVNFAYMYFALTDHNFMRRTPTLFITAYSLICGVLVMLEIVLLIYTFKAPPDNIIALPILLAATVIQGIPIFIDILFMVVYGHFWTVMFMNIFDAIIMTVVFARRYIFLSTAKKITMEEGREK